MNAFARSNKNNYLTIVTMVLSSVLILMGLQGCGSDSKPDNRPTLSISAPTVVEGQDGAANELIFTVTLSENAATALTLTVATTDDVATVADNDYTPVVSDTITIATGTNSATFSVYTIGDSVYEVPETFNLVVNNPQGLDIKTQSITGQGTITNDDNANPKGYFSGNARLNAIDLTDITGMMYNGRLMLFSPSQNVLFDITAFTSTVNDYTANVDVYVDGVKTTQTVTLTGTTDEMSITGTFDGGSGLATGSFSIVFDVNNNVAATSDRILHPGAGAWVGTIYGVDTDPNGSFRTDPNSLASGDYFIYDNTAPSCATGSELMAIPDNQVNIYTLSHRVQQNIDCQYLGVDYTGLTSVLSINAVNTLVFAYANGTYSLFGVMTY